MRDLALLLLPATVLSFAPAYVIVEVIVPWAWKAVRRWRERREQEWVSTLNFRVSVRLHGEVLEYWRCCGRQPAPGIRDRQTAQRWLLRDIKALGAQGAWDKHSKVANQMATGSSNRYTIGWVGPRATWPSQPVSSASTSYTLDFINRSLGLPAGDTQLKRAVDDCTALGYDLNQCLTHCRMYLGIFTAPPPTQSAQALGQMVPSPLSSYQQQVAWLGSQIAAAATAITPPRRPDPVNDPFLAANDFAEELGRWLKLDDKAVAALPVRAYMLWVAIRAAQKDGAPWHDMDAALHDMAGVEYVVPEPEPPAPERLTLDFEHDFVADAYVVINRATGERRIMPMVRLQKMPKPTSAEAVWAAATPHP